MVIDNADNAQLFFSQSADTAISSVESKDERNLVWYLPEYAYGTILIITRNKQVGVRLTKGEQLIEVLYMTEDESE